MEVPQNKLSLAVKTKTEISGHTSNMVASEWIWFDCEQQEALLFFIYLYSYLETVI